MGNHISAGQQCVVLRDVVVEGQYAFEKGERLIVEQISPNPGRPQYKYVVFSSRLQKRFQLSDQDITHRLSYPQAPITKRKGVGTRRRWLVVVASGVAVVAALLIAYFLVFEGLGVSGAEKTARDYYKSIEEKNHGKFLRTIDIPEETKAEVDEAVTGYFTTVNESVFEADSLKYETNVNGQNASVHATAKDGRKSTLKLIEKEDGKWYVVESLFIDVVKGKAFLDKVEPIISNMGNMAEQGAETTLNIIYEMKLSGLEPTTARSNARLVSLAQNYIPILQGYYNDYATHKTQLEEMTPPKSSWYDMVEVRDQLKSAVDCCMTGVLGYIGILEPLLSPSIPAIEEATSRVVPAAEKIEEGTLYIEALTNSIDTITNSLTRKLHESF